MSRTKTVLVLLPFLIMAAVVAARLLAGPGAGLLPLLALGPAFAATSGGLRHSVAVGFVALILAAGIIFTQHPHTSLRQEIAAFTAVGGVTAASVLVSLTRQRRDRELLEVRAVAEVAQRVLLRPVPERVGSVQLAVRYASAAPGAQIGGDLYEAMATQWGLRVIVGDVQGKGLTAVQTAAAVLGTFREAAVMEPDLPAIAARIEASLARQMASEQFVTAIFAQICGDASKAELLNCGHPPPLLANAAGAQFASPPGEAGLPLGLAWLADAPLPRLMIPLTPGDQLLLYTDGVSEARNRAGEYFPLASSPSLRQALSPDAALTQLSKELQRHVGHPLTDDAAMLLIRRAVQPAP